MTAYKRRHYLNNILVRTITTLTLLDGTLTVTLIPTLRPTLALLRQRLCRTSEAPLVLHTNRWPLYGDYLTMSRTKTNRRNNCQASYVGETSSNLSTRLTKHKWATRNGDVNNHIAEHHLQTKHQIEWDSVTCITYSTDYYKRLTLESWFANLEETPLNRSQQLPALYKWLIGKIKQN